VRSRRFISLQANERKIRRVHLKPRFPSGHQPSIICATDSRRRHISQRLTCCALVSEACSWAVGPAGKARQRHFTTRLPRVNPPSLYELGWSQGTVFNAELPLDAVVLDISAGQPIRSQGQHGRWEVVTQDCDLDLSRSDQHDPAIEIRPVCNDNPPSDWGIRSARLLLTEEDHIHSASPRTLVSPSVLATLEKRGTRLQPLPEVRRRALRTWLGLRYDRPAVPPELLPLARRIADTVSARRNRPIGTRVRDVLFQCDEKTSPVRFSLFAALDDPADEDAVRDWLAEIAACVPSDLGVADQIEAAPATSISLHLIETSYAADVSRLTWRPADPAPQGAA
jgi:hypothetical protein